MALSPFSRAFDRRHLQALAGSLSLLALALVLYHSLAGGTLLSANAYDSYLLQAQNWLEGRVCIANGEKYPWLELAIYNGEYYLSFPPVPSVLALPAAALGLALGNLWQALWALAALAGAYLCFWHAGHTPRACAGWALLATLSSGFFWLACSGGVWFQAQVLNFAFTVWGLFFRLKKQYASAFFLLALAVGCRPFTALFAFALWLPAALNAVKNRRWGSLLAFTAPAAAVALALGWYNFIRFGSPFEFGHSYLPEFVRDGGQFTTENFWANLWGVLRPVTLTSSLDLSFSTFNGFCLFVASPVFLLWAIDIAGAAAQKRLAPKDLLAPGLALITLVALCLHRTMGGWQFGARYTVDLIPLALWWYLARPRRPFGGGAVWLTAAGALFNFYGAAYMLSH